MTAPHEQPIEVVCDALAEDGAIAHRLKGAGSPAATTWPACQPHHKHPCANDRQPPKCEIRCTCVCNCDLPKYYAYSSLWATNRGAQLCQDAFCFGGIRR